ncbi:MAG: hypothetical protein CSA66_04510 [Proteobacteria bacterium]|nr:MAG: hypothetical protein CSA66_04510 [Pseudomonadota bacterium]
MVVGMLALVAEPALAKECKGTGVSHPNYAKVNGNKLVLNGMGIREATAFNVNVYVAALYLPEKTKSASKVINDDVDKKLVLHFVRDVDRSDIVEAWTDSFKKNGAISSQKAGLIKLNGWMRDMKEGDKMVYTYVPGEGVTILVKGVNKGTIEGADFMKAFFKIWFADPPNQGLKDGLLGKIPCED